MIFLSTVKYKIALKSTHIYIYFPPTQSPPNIIRRVLGRSSPALVSILPQSRAAVDHPQGNKVTPIDHKLVPNNERSHTSGGHEYRQQGLEEQCKEGIYAENQSKTVLDQELGNGGTENI